MALLGQDSQHGCTDPPKPSAFMFHALRWKERAFHVVPILIEHDTDSPTAHLPVGGVSTGPPSRPRMMAASLSAVRGKLSEKAIQKAKASRYAHTAAKLKPKNTAIKIQGIHRRSLGWPRPSCRMPNTMKPTVMAMAG